MDILQNFYDLMIFMLEFIFQSPLIILAYLGLGWWAYNMVRTFL